MFRIGRYSGVAAAISLLVIGGWFLFSGPGTNVSFAQVIEKIRDAKSFSYEVVNEPLGNTQSPGWEKNIMKVFFREPGLLREERPGGVVMIQNITAGKTLRYDPSTKTATLYPFKPQPPWLAFRKFFLDKDRNGAMAPSNGWVSEKWMARRHKASQYARMRTRSGTSGSMPRRPIFFALKVSAGTGRP